MEPTSADAACLEGGRMPLPALLTMAASRFGAEFDRRLHELGCETLSVSAARTVLRHLGAQPRRASTMVDDCGVSKQALSQQIAQLESSGLIKVESDPSDARARLLSLTPAGLEAQRSVLRLFDQIEGEWIAALGNTDIEGARRVLTALASRPRPERP